MAHAVGEVIGQRPKQQPDLTPIVGREAELERLQQASTWRGCGSCRSSSSSVSPASASRGSCRSSGRSRSASSSSTVPAEQYSSTEPFSAVRTPLRQLVGITPDRSAAEAGSDAAAVRDRDDARPRAVAPAARDPVRRRGRRNPRDGGARSCGEPRQAALGGRDVPRADPDDADAPRDRGRSLARRRVAVPARPSRPAACDAPVARVRDDATGRRCDRAGGRPQHAARARAARRSGRRGARDRRSRRSSPSRSKRSARSRPGRAATRSSSASSCSPRSTARRSTSCRRPSRAC